MDPDHTALDRWDVMDGIGWAESGNQHINPKTGKVFFYSKTKATGKYQIIPICLDHFNFRNGTDWPFSYMSNEICNYMVAVDHIRWMTNDLGYSLERAVNGHNMGFNCKDVNLRYMRKVFGSWDFMKGRKITRTIISNGGRKYYKVWPPF